MEKTFNIYSEIVSGEGSKWTSEDICLSDFTNFAKELNEGDEVTIDINSPGGSVTEGIAIANQIRELSKKGFHTTAKVEGICASIATVIMCACDNIVLNDTAFLMIHNCWSVVQGDAETLRKEADIMEKMNEAILSFYRSKFDLTDQELKDYMDAETWFSGAEAENFKLKCEVVKSEHEFKIAACVKKFDFKNTPKRILDMENLSTNEDTQETTKVGDTVEDTTSSSTTKEDIAAGEEVTVPLDEKNAETVETEVSTSKEEDKHIPLDEIDPENTQDIEALRELLFRAYEMIGELEDENEEKAEENKSIFNKLQSARKENDELKEKMVDKIVDDDSDKSETITKAECEKRVSGMQASMQKQINDFQNQLKAKNEELISAKAEITRLEDSLRNTSEELSKVASALEEKKQALEVLNSSVNAKAEELPTYKEGLEKCKTPQEKVEFIKSGKWKK